ncbi:unnamed protein product [Rhizophagus irregularis]|nr:unnamed protein product [Rhizophagus irregularis]
MNETKPIEVGGADSEKDDINYITTNGAVSLEVGGADSEKDDINYITTEMNEDVFVKVGGADSKKDDINYKPPHNEISIITLQTENIEEFEERQIELSETTEVETQEETKEQINAQTSCLLDILRPLLNNRIYDPIKPYYPEDCKFENLSKIVQDTKSIKYIIGTLNGSILDGNMLNIKFKVLVDKLERLNVHPFGLYADDINDENLQEASSFNNDQWEISCSYGIEIKCLENNKNNDILLVLNEKSNNKHNHKVSVRVFIFHFEKNNGQQ